MKIVIISVLFIFMRMSSSKATDTPVIGILALESAAINEYFPNREIDSYIAASYVKFLESAGARVIPIWLGQKKEYYERAVKYTNGILFPGGATYFNESNGFAESAKKIFDVAQKINDDGVYFPLIGICLGMQVMAYASSGGKDNIRIGCSAMKISLPLEFLPDFRTSRVFQDVQSDILTFMQTKNVTYNYHKFCLTEDVIRRNNLTDVWRIVTENVDVNGDKFISIMEHKKYPFYGFQFHPEKIKHEFQEKLKIPHDVPSMKVSQYFADFSVGECRKNDNSFPSSTILHDSLIYNFNPVLSAANCSYQQVYLFSDEEPKKYQLTD